MKLKVYYAGAYPCLCGGKLIITIDGEEWVFPEYCLSSGGSVWFDDNWNEHVETGEWEITDWPKNFPEKYKQAALNAVNAEIEHGCCGGCI